MTYPRSALVPQGAPGVFHCVSRCVRRAFLCGEDSYSGRSFEHRRQWVEDRLREVGEIFAVSIWGFAVMSNHLHVVVQTLPEVASAGSDVEVAERWVRLFPRPDQAPEMRARVLSGHVDRVAVLRGRLADLSWFMRCTWMCECRERRTRRSGRCTWMCECRERRMRMSGRVLSEPIARRANKEDICKGRFWAGFCSCKTCIPHIHVRQRVDSNAKRSWTMLR